MQVVYHIGAHVTDEDRLLRCLLKNVDRLHRSGISVPGPSRYRKLISQTLSSLSLTGRGALSPAELLEEIVEEADVSRLILSFEGFSAGPKQVVRDGQLYGRLERQAERLAMLFDGAEIEFHMAIRNPVTFLPALARRENTPSLPEILSQVDPARVMWSDVVRQLKEAVPDARVVIWCNEDSPLIWGDILRSLTGLPPDAEDLIGSYDPLEPLLTKEGYAKFTTRLAARPFHTPETRHQLIEEHLDKYARPDQIDEEVDLPGWSQTDVQNATDTYYEDVDAIEKMDGVELIAP